MNFGQVMGAVSGQVWNTSQISRDLARFIILLINDKDVSAELTRKIRTEVESINRTNNLAKNHYNGPMLTYEALTSGNVNMQARMAASGYDVYGHTYLKENKNASNQNTYKKMKNKIKYGRSPQKGYINRGQYTIE